MGKPITSDRLKKEFILPPFSVLNSTTGNWQERKRWWLSLGIKSEEGRDQNLLGFSKTVVAHGAKNVSIFDPVLCELMYKWFCPIEGTILDPFAGGSVRGIVAEYNGYHYTGIELRPEQVESNKEQAKEIGVSAKWVVGNSRHIVPLMEKQFDFIFSCPPYYDLEVYSKLEGELSNISTYDEFMRDYRSIIKSCVDRLKDNRFACFVVSEIRDKEGYYQGFVRDTIKAFEDAGMKYYNELILVGSTGSLGLRIKKFFVPTRKIGRMHQNVLVFYKGNPKEIFPIKMNYAVENINKWFDKQTEPEVKEEKEIDWSI